MFSWSKRVQKIIKFCKTCHGNFQDFFAFMGTWGSLFNLSNKNTSMHFFLHFQIMYVKNGAELEFLCFQAILFRESNVCTRFLAFLWTFCTSSLKNHYNLCVDKCLLWYFSENKSFFKKRFFVLGVQISMENDSGSKWSYQKTISKFSLPHDGNKYMWKSGNVTGITISVS